IVPRPHQERARPEVHHPRARTALVRRLIDVEAREQPHPFAPGLDMTPVAREPHERAPGRGTDGVQVVLTHPRAAKRAAGTLVLEEWYVLVARVARLEITRRKLIDPARNHVRKSIELVVSHLAAALHDVIAGVKLRRREDELDGRCANNLSAHIFLGEV